ncbi:TIGR01212 family radical SAM protein [Clostridium botulinum]|uniref:Radical SAM protein, family n=1 Tax=Clostridium botulinum (strain Eklund 17B / Type B) TaxID=935198 RepID=B2THU2_CLOBB|nr:MULTISPECIES: TIGR01212 family radical SAM protein [unclassified Clostridium]ACD21747.1 radical SAM protein, family [Clostridium botulinum B str. Eklund 17B (NRP)]MBN1043835.1 TIGR01212 family radical SAM protein [Clostridium botulinum]MBN1050511.1 TIGR01212 family radical SAM protein [Clostridium botulinum]MBY6977380.1 TIGR01212 family radical SAM protein [Clostridium botulinum]MBY7001936.1 TIGR01212 family radical SAM protein [Clostridium botulinum]
MNNSWNGKRYHSLNYFLREKFGEKVFKISLDGGFSCPNRDGKVSKGGCVFCSARGSGDYAGSRNFSITGQFNNVKTMMANKWKSGKYIAYFQAYTNTYAPVDELRQKYEEAINQEGVVALSIATRPDCLEDDVLDLIEELSKKLYVWVELGLQTINDDVAKKINRGYDLKVFDNAMTRLKERNIDVVVHSILGLPGESQDDMLKTIDYIAHSGAQGIKLHLLHLMKDTKMVELYENGELQFLSQEDYIKLICRAVSMLPKEMVVHRLTGDAPRDLLIGPMWSLKKWEVLNAIDKTLEDNDIYQGKNFDMGDI